MICWEKPRLKANFGDNCIMTTDNHIFSFQVSSKGSMHLGNMKMNLDLSLTESLVVSSHSMLLVTTGLLMSVVVE